VRELDVPLRCKNLNERALSGKSRDAAIRLFCLTRCAYSQREVVLCEDHECPLHKYRLSRQQRYLRQETLTVST
jgi:hypothetical protein